MNDQSVSCELEGERMHQREGGRVPGIISSYLLQRVIQPQGVVHHRELISRYRVEKEEKERIQTGRQNGLDRIKIDHDLMRSRVSEAEKFLQEISEKEAEEKRLRAAEEAKQKAFDEFKIELVSRKTGHALILARKLRKLLKSYWFRRDYKVVWRKYSKEKVAAYKMAICFYKNNIRRLRKIKMNTMVSLGVWIKSH